MSAVRTTSPAPEKTHALLGALGRILPSDSLLSRPEQTVPFDCDGLAAFRQTPLAVTLPQTEAQVRDILRICNELGVPVVARGAGTGLSGGAMPCADGIVLSLAKLNRILDIDPVACIARVQPGVRNLAVSEAAAQYGLYYAPDPSSQIACTIGGNVAENSGGVHCLKYGLTIHNVLGMRGYTIDGEPIAFGGSRARRPGPGSARADDRLGRIARRRHRSHAEARAATEARARRHGVVRRRRQSRQRGRRDHRGRHHSGRPGDDGPQGDAMRSSRSSKPATT